MRFIDQHIKVFFLCSLFLAPASSYAQTWAFELWHEGKIILLTGDTLRGLVKYDFQQDIVQYDMPNDRTEAFSARKVLSFEIFDNTVKKYRRFYALPFSAAGSYKIPVFFELLEEGKMTLLAREALEYRTYSSPYFIGSYTRLVLIHKFFFLEEDGDIVEFDGSRNELLEKMGARSDAVEKFIRQNKLRMEDKYDFARIIAYYNSFFTS